MDASRRRQDFILGFENKEGDYLPQETDEKEEEPICSIG